MSVFPQIISDIICTIITAFVTIVGVWYTVSYSKKDTNKTIQQAKEDTDRTLRESEISARKQLYASVKPIVYCVRHTKTCERTIDFKAKDFSSPNLNFSAYLKNTNNGIAIIEKMTFNKTDYFPTMDCVIDKGDVIEIKLFGVNGIATHGSISVYDIYGNPYCCPITLYSNHFRTENSPSIKELQENNTNSINAETGNISNSSVTIGNNNAQTEISGNINYN